MRTSSLMSIFLIISICLTLVCDVVYGQSVTTFEAEPNNSIKTANDINVYDSIDITGNFNNSDVDYFKLSINKVGYEYNIVLSSNSGDPFIEIFDENGNSIGKNDNCDDINYNSCMKITAMFQVYYLKAGTTSRPSTAYNLKISRIATNTPSPDTQGTENNPIILTLNSRVSNYFLENDTGVSHYYILSVKQSKTYVCESLQSGNVIDTLLTVNISQKHVNDDSDNSTTYSRVEFTPSVTGVATIVVTKNSLGKGGYILYCSLKNSTEVTPTPLEFDKNALQRIAIKATPPPQVKPTPFYTSVALPATVVLVYYDSNGNKKNDIGEGVGNMTVLVVDDVYKTILFYKKTNYKGYTVVYVPPGTSCSINIPAINYSQKLQSDIPSTRSIKTITISLSGLFFPGLLP